MNREATLADAVQGRLPRAVYEPASIDEAREVLARLARDRQACVFVGGGTKLGLGAPPTRLDAVVRTGRLTRIVEYAPPDQVVTVEAGLTLAALQERLAQDRQQLSLDPPWPGESTLGGIIAANAFGPLRARSGAVRDLILGVSLIRADGVLARGGGKVVKNVAGFDLPKLVCGSLGTLGMIAAATLRVHPLPESTEVRVVRGLRADEVPALIGALREAQLEPAALLARRGASDWEVALQFDGFGAGVAQQIARLGSLAPAEASGANPFAEHRAARERAALRLKLAALPTALPLVEAAVASLSALYPGAELAWYPTLGLGFFSATPPHAEAVDTAALASALATARQRLAAMRGSLTLENAPDALHQRFEPWSAPTSLALHRAVKSRFDPDGLLAPGRFVGGI
jgi:glycolate oxidase FAD binding subunit